MDKLIYPEFVRSILKPALAIYPTVTVAKVNLLHLALGISGEAGELTDPIKKHFAYDQPLDRENMIEEMGDMEFYLEALRQELGISRETIIAANIAKLQKRYEEGYSDKAAAERKDK